MPLVDAKCTNCGAPLKLDNTKDAAICEHCGSAFIVEKAINNYNITNQNTIHAQVVNVYNNDKENTKQNAQKIIKEFISTLQSAGYNRLVSPQKMLEVIKLVSNTSDEQEILQMIQNYDENLNFKFDFSYSPNGLCKLTNKKHNSYSFQSLWKDSGNLGEDGKYFTEWILFNTSKLSINNNLKRIQKKLTDYYIFILMQGKTDADWDNERNGSIWGVERTSKLEFLNIEKNLKTSFYYHISIKAWKTQKQLIRFHFVKNLINLHLF